MAGTVRHAKLESRASRARLKRGRQPHWRAIVPGRVHLGYRRWPEDREGSWLLRRYVDGKYRVLALGAADDEREADGERVLSFEQAHAAAIAQAGAPKGQLPRITVRQAMERYIDFKEAQGQPTVDLRSRSAAHILPILGDVAVADLTSERIRKWLATLATSPAMKRSPNGSQNYKPEAVDDEGVRQRRSSANRVLTMLKAGLNHTYDEGHVTTNAAWGRKVKPFRDVELARVRYLSIAEAQRLINGCDVEFRPLVQAALATGCRYSELTRCEAADFNRDAGTVTIRKSKNSKARHVVLTEEGAAFFSELTTGKVGSDLIFKRQDGKPWKSSHQGRPMAEANKRAKLKPRITFHGLRHTWASLSVMSGVPLMVVAKNMGHVDTRMVEKHYGHLAPSFIADAIRAGAPRFGFERNAKIVPLKTRG